jgi:hypothetical protein
MPMGPDTHAASPPPFYDGLVADTEKSLAAGSLIGLDEELKSLRQYVNDFARQHPDRLDLIIKGLRLIMQMVLAQHRMGAEQMAESYEALEQATRHLREQFLTEDTEDV